MEDVLIGYPFNLALIRPKPGENTLIEMKRATHYGFRYSFRSLDDLKDVCNAENNEYIDGTLSFEAGDSLVIFSEFVKGIQLESKNPPAVCDLLEIANGTLKASKELAKKAIEVWRKAVENPIEEHPVLDRIRAGLNLVANTSVSRAVDYIFSPKNVEEAVAGDIILFSLLAERRNIWHIPVLYIRDNEWALVTFIIDIDYFENINFVTVPDEVRKVYMLGGIYEAECPPYIIAQTGIVDSCFNLIEQMEKKLVEKEGEKHAVFSYTFFLREEKKEESKEETEYNYEGDFVYIASCSRLGEIKRVLDPETAKKVYKIIKGNKLTRLD